MHSQKLDCYHGNYFLKTKERVEEPVEGVRSTAAVQAVLPDSGRKGLIAHGHTVQNSEGTKQLTTRI